MGFSTSNYLQKSLVCCSFSSLLIREDVSSVCKMFFRAGFIWYDNKTTTTSPIKVFCFIQTFLIFCPFVLVWSFPALGSVCVWGGGAGGGGGVIIIFGEMPTPLVGQFVLPQLGLALAATSNSKCYFLKTVLGLSCLLDQSEPMSSGALQPSTPNKWGCPLWTKQHPSEAAGHFLYQLKEMKAWKQKAVAPKAYEAPLFIAAAE